ncbi:MAG TPA: hypothetical protein VMF57_02100 [Solirubrobacteraceae bacterium]|nr:hypothetical protein [Solirubrobacteraceae bacterium]
MSAAFPRPLSDREQALLDVLLAEQFSGVEALRVQAQSVRVRGLHEGLPTVVLLEVADRDAPRADVVHAVPVEAVVRGEGELLLFVKQGLLDSIELVTYAGDEPAELPTVEALERPWVKTADSQKPRSDG